MPETNRVEYKQQLTKELDIEKEDITKKGLVESQQKIVRMIAKDPKVSKKEMSESIGISTTSIDKNIVTLKGKNIIRRVGSDKGGYWQIIDEI